MTTLNEFINGLVKLQAEGHGEKQVFAVHGASGSCDEIGSACVKDYVGDAGPFDLEPNEEYISIYTGN